MSGASEEQARLRVRTNKMADLIGEVPLRLSADLPLPSLTLRELGHLHPGQVLISGWSVADDLLLTLGGAPLCWGRFAALDGRMVLRVVRLV